MMIYAIVGCSRGELRVCRTPCTFNYFLEQLDSGTPVLLLRLEGGMVCSRDLSPFEISGLKKLDQLSNGTPTLKQFFENNDILEWIHTTPSLRGRKPW